MIIGNAIPLIHNDQEWEGSIVEGPSMYLHNNGQYILFYSANAYEGYKYAVGFALCDSPLGPCRKPVYSPVLRFGSNTWGPGGSEFFMVAGKLWICYHGWSAPRATYASGGQRSLRIDTVDFVHRFNETIAVVNGPTDWLH